MGTRRLRWSLLAVGATILPPTFAQAQSAPPLQPPLAAQPEAAVQEVVVTAQRREERLQDVPIAVRAVSGEQLVQAGITSAQDLQQVAPGLQMAQVRNDIQPYLRGVGTQNTSPGEEGSVALYMDGVYVNYLSAATFGLANVQRVEVLKGPQGTLFGRNATGGLINVITRDPSQTTGVIADVSYADYDTTALNFYVTGGLTSTISANLSAYYRKQADGYGTNLVRGGDANKESEESFSGKLRFDFTPIDRLILEADGGLLGTDIGNSRSFLPNRANAVGGPYDTQANDLNDAETNYWGAYAKYTHSFSFADLESLTAYRYYDEDVFLDQDGGPKGSIYLTGVTPIRTLQQELSLTGSVGKLQWRTGLIYYWASAGYQPQTTLSAVTPKTDKQNFTKMETNSYAAYVQGTYALTSATKLTAGVRYTEDQREITGVSYAYAMSAAPPGTVLSSAHQERTFDEPAWRFSLDHKFATDLLGYVSYSRGFKSGIFSTNSFANPAVNPETLDAYEIGLKSTWFDRRLIANVSGFYYDYKNLQLSQVFAGGSRILNAAEARPDGVDFDFTARPPVGFGVLTLGGGASFLHAYYASFPNAPATFPLASGLNSSGVVDASGHHMIRSPDFTSELSLDYEAPFGKGTAGGTLLWSYNDAFYFDPDNRVRQPAYALLNLRLRYTLKGVEYYVYANNLTDKRYLTASSDTTLGDLGVYGRPRIFGVGVRFER